MAFVEEVNWEGVGVHLDAGAMALAGEDPRIVIPQASAWLRHFHISEPFLRAVGVELAENHAACAEALRAIGYGGWISVEMRSPSSDAAVEAIDKARFARTVYDGVAS